MAYNSQPSSSESSVINDDNLEDTIDIEAYVANELISQKEHERPHDDID